MVTIATCQLTPSFDKEARKKQLQDMLKRAMVQKADFVLFPEGFLTGYYEEEELARSNSLDVEEAAFFEWLELVEKSAPETTVIVGFNERKGNALFNSAAVIENGRLLGIQRKHHLYHSYFTAGNTFAVFESKGVLFDVVICLDTIYFEPARVLALQNTSILFSPMCNRVPLSHPYAQRPPYYSHFVARSFENCCWLLSADWVWPNDGVSICPGHSAVYDPDGQEVIRSQEGEEDLLFVDIARERIFHEKGGRVKNASVLF